jgi:hypothetical protein
MERTPYVIFIAPQSRLDESARREQLKLATKVALHQGQTPITPELLYQPLLDCVSDLSLRREIVAALALQWQETLSEHRYESYVLLSDPGEQPSLSPNERVFFERSKAHQPYGLAPWYCPDYFAEHADISLPVAKGAVVDLSHITLATSDKIITQALLCAIERPQLIPTVIESPFAGEIPKHLTYAFDVLPQLLNAGRLPFGSHFVYTQVLDDNKAGERELGIAAGLAMYDVCHHSVYLLDHGVSVGMERAYEAQAAHHQSCDYWLEDTLHHQWPKSLALPAPLDKKTQSLDMTLKPESSRALKR